MLNIGKERERKRDGKAITKEEIECVYKRRIFFNCVFIESPGSPPMGGG